MKKIIAIILSLVLASSIFMSISSAIANWQVSTFATVSAPWDAEFDASGNLFVSSIVNNAVYKVDPAGNVTTYATISSPTGLVFDASGNLYVCGSNGVIYKIDPAQHSSVFATLIQDPIGIDVASNGDLYVVERNGGRLSKITPAGQVTTIINQGVISMPNNVKIGPDGKIYISSHSGYIKTVDPNNNYAVATFAGNGWGTDDGAANVAKFTMPEGLAFDASGYLYVAELGNRIRKIDPSGNVTTFAGPINATTSGYVDGNLADARFNGPVGIAISNDGSIYVSEYSNSRIRKLAAAPAPTPTPTPNTFVPTTGVTLNTDKVELIQSRHGYLIAEVAPVHASNQKVSWSSSDDGVVSVDAKGILTATGFGQAVVTVKTDDGGHTASATITVPGPSKVVAKELGYIHGYKDGTFRPDNKVSQGELALMLARLLKIGDGTVADSIRLLTEKGLLVGSVRADADVTKGEWNAIARRYLGKQDAFGYTFSGSQVKEVLSREQAVLVLNKLFKVALVRTVNTPTFKDVPKLHRSLNQIESAVK